MRFVDRLHRPVATILSATLILAPLPGISQIDVQLLQPSFNDAAEASTLALARARVALLDARDAVDSALADVSQALDLLEQASLNQRGPRNFQEVDALSADLPGAESWEATWLQLQHRVSEALQQVSESTQDQVAQLRPALLRGFARVEEFVRQQERLPGGQVEPASFEFDPAAVVLPLAGADVEDVEDFETTLPEADGFGSVEVSAVEPELEEALRSLGKIEPDCPVGSLAEPEALSVAEAVERIQQAFLNPTPESSYEDEGAAPVGGSESSFPADGVPEDGAFFLAPPHEERFEDILRGPASR